MQEEDDADGDVLRGHARTQPDFGGQETGLNINRSKKKHSPHFAPTDLLALPAQKSSASNHHQAQKKRQLEPGILRALGDGPDRLPAPKLRRQRRHERVGVLRPHAQVSHDPHAPTATPRCNPICMAKNNQHSRQQEDDEDFAVSKQVSRPEVSGRFVRHISCA